MNQPYPPYGPQQPGPYGQGSSQPGPYSQPVPYAQQYDVAYPTNQGYGQPYAGGPTGSALGGYGPPPPQRSKLPIWIALGVVVALAAGIGLFFLLRDGDSGGGTASGPSTTVSAPGPEEVTKSFFEAVDAMDEKGMQENARGEVEDDIEQIMDGGAEDLGISFSDGSATDSVTKEVDDIELAVVIWELQNLPDDFPSDQGELTVFLLDDGDGFKICQIDTPYGPEAKDVLEDFELSYEEECAYTG